MVQDVKKQEFEKIWLGEIAGVARQPPNIKENWAQVGAMAGMMRQTLNFRRIFDQHLGELSGAASQREPNFRGNSSQVLRDEWCSVLGPVREGFSKSKS
ncbi:hypothetical protein HAX54_004175 [Datura stramonium]|uniref:Uncharacterized protein n=1 Tax=Datura stramonium TaxID=4076 RepID=A0ABS8RTT1_DATST|nr:hypothetical protein [Datura stramonium]